MSVKQGDTKGKRKTLLFLFTGFSTLLIFTTNIATANMWIIQFHWQFLFTNSRFWLVNILLCKFDNLSKKEIKYENPQNSWWKTTKNAKKKEKHKITFFILNSPCRLLIWHAPNFREAERIQLARNCQWNTPARFCLMFPVSKTSFCIQSNYLTVAYYIILTTVV